MIAGNSRFLPHFHIPLQSGSDMVLRKMGRRYDTSVFAHKVRYIHDLMPCAFIGVDVIAGFPGETEDAFRQTYDLLEELRPSFLHVFPFSLRPETRAASYPVTERVREGILPKGPGCLEHCLTDCTGNSYMQTKAEKKKCFLKERPQTGKCTDIHAIISG